jgi:hypothetical protein
VSVDAVEGFRRPRARRVTGPQRPGSNNKVERGRFAPTDITELQMERYAAWPVEAQQFARTKDAVSPLWSCTHRWRPVKEKDIMTISGTTFSATVEMQWGYDWPSAAAIYVYGDMGLREMAKLCGINERRLFWASSRYGWADQKGTFERLREREASSLNIMALDEAARATAIRGTFTEVGMGLLRKCMVALNAKDEIDARDIAPLMDKAIRLIGAGEKMPIEYRHSVVDNPNSHPQGAVVNAVVLTSQTADQVLAALAERARVLQDARARSVPAVSPTT